MTGSHNTGAHENSGRTTKSSAPRKPANALENANNAQVLCRESTHRFVCGGPPASPYSRDSASPGAREASLCFWTVRSVLTSGVVFDERKMGVCSD